MKNFWARILRYRREHPIGYRFLIYILVFNGFLTLVSTAVQFMIDLNWEAASIEKRIIQIGESYDSNLANALWAYDIDSVRLQLQGITEIPDFKYVVIRTITGEKYEEGKPVTSFRSISRTFPLWYGESSENLQLGLMEITASLEGVYQRFFRRLVLILIINAIKTFPISIFILVLFNRLVARQLNEISNYARLLNLDRLDHPLVLTKKFKSTYPDEFDHVVNAINKMRLSLLNHLTERRKIEEHRIQMLEKTQQALQMREDFIDIASHELRTPITPLKMQIDLIEKTFRKSKLTEIPEFSFFSRSIESMRNQVNHLARLVENFLDASRLESLTLNRAPVDLSELVQSVVSGIQEQIRVAKYDVSLDLQPEVIGVWDRVRIEQVIMNLLSNALKYGLKKNIRIRVTSEGSKAVLIVQDSGIGISKEAQARIFNRFERAVPISKFGGMGLGLYISRQIVEAHGGSIHLVSEPGKGSVFTVWLPLGEKVS